MGACVSRHIEVGEKIAINSSNYSLEEDEESWTECSENAFAKPKAQPEYKSKNAVVKATAPLPGKFGLSKMVFPSNDALKLSRTLFTSYGCSEINKSTLRCSTQWIVPVIPVTKVTSQLYFGTFEDANNASNLLHLGITHVISLIGPKNLIKNIKHMHCPINDYGRSDLKVVFSSLWEFVIESQYIGNKLFVHCQSGQNRSATLVIAILMKHEGKTLKDAYKIVKRKRPVVQINKHYAKQLRAMEFELFGDISMASDWMEINSVDMDTGKVVFSGDPSMANLQTVRTVRKDSNELKTYKLNPKFKQLRICKKVQ